MGELVLIIFSTVVAWIIYNGLYKWCDKKGWLNGPHFLDL